MRTLRRFYDIPEDWSDADARAVIGIRYELRLRQGLSNLPPKLPPHTLLILDDRFPCQGHSPGLVADQLNSITDSFHCENLLLDFQRPPDAESSHMVQTIASQLVQNPVVPPAYCHDPSFPVFLPPCPLHLTMEEYIAPWCNREIWLEAGLCQESISIES